MRVTYPIVIDSDYAIWRAFDNHYWPALYFVDARGRVRQHHFGEGDYEQSEKAIQRLLAEAGAAGSDANIVSVDAIEPKRREFFAQDCLLADCRSESARELRAVESPSVPLPRCP